MRLILSSLIVLSVLVVGISQASAYDGDIRVLSSPKDDTIGTTYHYEFFLKNAVPTPNEMVNVKLLDNQDNILDEFLVNVDSAPTLVEDADEIWKFDFSIDTSKYDLLTDVEYTVQVTFEDKTVKRPMVVYPTLEQSIIDAGNAKAENTLQSSITLPIPEWIRNIFVFYANDQISDIELINAIQYLIDAKILKV